MKKVLLFIAACVMSIAANAQVDLTMEDFTINAGETKNVTLDLTNNVDITGFQCDILASEGLSVALGTFESKRVPKDEDDEWLHTRGGVAQEDGSFRVLVYSTMNDCLKGTEGGVIKIKVTANGDVKNGTLKIYNKEITEPNGTAHKPAETTTNVNGATGITNIVAESLEGAKFFGADGVQTNGAQKGLNIVKTNNGVRKVMVK